MSVSERTTVQSAAPEAPSDFRSEIQGLRALAVGLVVLFHLWPRRVSGGYVGVDVFFVISGYLITSHIAREIDATGRLRPVRFWARRIRRLLPASMLVLAASAVLVVTVIPVEQWTASARQLAASAMYVQNWALATDAVDYMAQDNVPTVVQHYWSLSVEEQFYAVWPLLIIALLALQRRLSRTVVTPERTRRLLAVGLGVLVAGSLFWSIRSTAADQPFAYMSSLTRVWEFAAGGVTALVTVRLARSWALVAGWAGAVMVVVAGFVFTERSMFPGVIAVLPVLGTVLLIVAGRDGPGTVGWWMARRPAVFVGDISYSVYLVHWPLIVAAPYLTGHKLRWPEKLLIIAATLLLAWLSKTYVEDPLRRRPLLAAAPWRAFAFAVAGIVALVSVNVALTGELGRRDRAASGQVAARLATPEPCLGPGALNPSADCDSIAGDGPLLAPFAVLNRPRTIALVSACQQTLESPALKSCAMGARTGATRTAALLGDSHAGHWAPMMDALGRRLGWSVIGMAKSSCPMTLARRVLPKETSDDRQLACEAFNAAAIARVSGDPAITDVFVADFAGAYTFTSAPGRRLADPASEGFQSLWRTWTAAGKRVWVLNDVPSSGPDLPPACLAAHPDDPDACARPRSQAVRPDVQAEAARTMGDPNVQVVDLTDQFCDADRCYFRIGDVVVYRNRSHLTVEYATLLAPYVIAQLGASATG